MDNFVYIRTSFYSPERRVPNTKRKPRNNRIENPNINAFKKCEVTSKCCVKFIETQPVSVGSGRALLIIPTEYPSKVCVKI